MKTKMKMKMKKARKKRIGKGLGGIHSALKTMRQKI